MTPGDLARVAEIRARADAATDEALVRRVALVIRDVQEGWNRPHLGNPMEGIKQERAEAVAHAVVATLAAARADVPWLLDRLAAETERADTAEAAIETRRERKIACENMTRDLRRIEALCEDAERAARFIRPGELRAALSPAETDTP